MISQSLELKVDIEIINENAIKGFVNQELKTYQEIIENAHILRRNNGPTSSHTKKRHISWK